MGTEGVAVAPHFDQKNERYQIRIERTRHGNVRITSIDTGSCTRGTMRRSGRRRRCCAT